MIEDHDHPIKSSNLRETAQSKLPRSHPRMDVTEGSTTIHLLIGD